MTKPLFRWVLPSDGQQKPAKDIVGHCTTIQRFYLDLQERRTSVGEAKELIEAMSEIMVEHGILIAAPQWFAELFKKRSETTLVA